MELFEKLVGFHRERWEKRGVPGVLTPERIQQQHRASIPLLEQRGLLRFYALDLNGKTLAVLYALADPPATPEQCCYFYLLGFDPSAAELGPGTLMFDFMIDACAAEGITTLDLLRGDESYKRLWGAQPYPTFGFRLSSAVP